MSKTEENQFEVPFQVQQLLVALKDKKERVHIRGNYRHRLDVIRSTIDRAVREYDIEMGNVQDPNRNLKKGQR